MGKDGKKHKQKAPPPAFQASVGRLATIASQYRYRRVPGREAGKIDRPWVVNGSKVSLEIDHTSQWMDMIGPIGVYYIYLTDVQPTYRQAFTNLLWWMFKLRQRRQFKNMLDPDSSEWTYYKWGREALATLEYLMPRNWCRITVHLMQHVCDTLRLAGPVHATWMFVYERWMKLGKGFMHSAKGAGEGMMNSAMTHEWLMRNMASTRDDLNKLLTPPLSHTHRDNPYIALVGAHRDVNLHPQRADKTSHFRLICNYLLTNDDAMNIINNEFVHTYPVQSKNGSKVIYDWTPSLPSYSKVIDDIRRKFDGITVTPEDIKRMIAGPYAINEYCRISVNGVIFTTHQHESKVSRVTRKYLHYRTAYDKLAVARLDKIYHVMSRGVGKPMQDSILLKVSNYKFTTEKHESGLLCVQPLTEQQNVHAMPIIRAEDIAPVNIALWPTTTVNPQKCKTFLVVHTDPEFMHE